MGMLLFKSEFVNVIFTGLSRINPPEKASVNVKHPLEFIYV